MTGITIAGETFNVCIEGGENKESLMLSNPMGTNLHVWDPQIPALTRHFRVVRGGRAKSFKVKDLYAKTINKVLFNNIVLDSRLHPMKRSITRSQARNLPSMSASIIRKANMFVAM
jgi:hypothetical protein